MLRKFKVQNFKNFKETVELDLTAGNYEFNTEATKNQVVKNAIIYGHNASGKSNIVRGIMDITGHLTDFNINKEDYNTYVNFESNNNFASFVYEFKFEEDIVEYSYKKRSVTEVFDEKIYINGNLIISSVDKILNLKGTQSLNLDLDENPISFVRYVFRNTIMDETDKNVNLFINFYKFVNGMLSFHSLQGNRYQGFQSGRSSLTDLILEYSTVNEFEKFLQSAGINYNLATRTIDDEDNIVVVFPNKKEVNIFALASKGTQSLILFYVWLLRFPKVSLVLMDEFDSYYHNNLTKFVIQSVVKTEVQSIFSSHNTSVMTNDILRPDCYYVLEQGKINPIYKTTNRELRKAHNIEKMYRAGAFKLDE